MKDYANLFSAHVKLLAVSHLRGGFVASSVWRLRNRKTLAISLLARVSLINIFS